MNFQMFKLDLEKAGESDQIANIHWILEKAREFQKKIYFCFIDYAKAFDCGSKEELMLSNYGVGEDSWESVGLQGYQTSQS